MPSRFPTQRVSNWESNPVKRKVSTDFPAPPISNFRKDNDRCGNKLELYQMMKLVLNRIKLDFDNLSFRGNC